MGDIKNFKPTIKKPVGKLSKNFEKNFDSTMAKYNVKLDEADSLLSEVEQSIKKKIFSLAKMETLVFSDPKLTSVYEQMAENGEEKYGYHYNETIMNMIFNDYILNSPKYLQKYKMAVPKKKKRRDKSGINQLKKAGEETQSKVGEIPKFKPAKNPAYKPEENESTGAASSGAFSPSLGYQQKAVDETTGAGSSGAYAGPAAWSKSGDLSGDFKKSGKGSGRANPIRKPIWQGGSVIAESNYLIETNGFEEFFNMLNEADLSIDSREEKIDFISNNSDAYGNETKNMSNKDINTIDGDMKTHTWDKANLSTMEENNSIDEEAKSKAQQKLFGMAHAVQKGELSPSKVGGAVKKIANTVDPTDVEDFASTKHKGLPEKKKKINEVLSLHDVVEYVSDRNGENVFNMGGDRWQFVNAKYPNGKIDIGVYRYGTDLVYDYSRWQEEMNIQESNINENMKKNIINEARINELIQIAENAQISRTAPNHPLVAKFLEIHPDYTDANWKGISEILEKMEELGESFDDVNFINTVEYMLGTIAPDFLEFINQNKEIPQPNMSEEMNFYQNLDPKQAIEKAGMDYNLAMKQGNQGQAEKIAGNLKSKLSISNYNWQQDPRALEIIGEDSQSMVNPSQMTMANKQQPAGDQPSGLQMGMSSTSGGGSAMEEANEKLFKEINEELEAYSIFHNKLKIMAEERKPSSLIMKDRLGDENKANFKKDLNQSGTKEIIDIQKELQYKDQQTEIGDDPQKLGQDIEDTMIKKTKGQSFENVGDSANDKGNEIPKRNMTSDEQHSVDMMRNGQHSLVYDNKPNQKFEDRMKADMGDKIYDMRQEQMEYKSHQSMYNKDAQPTEPTAVKTTQYDKNKSKWNDENGLSESMITGRYEDLLGKKHIIDFQLKEAVELTTPSDTARQTGLFELDFTGFGNKYISRTENYKVSVNESVDSIISANKFYTNGKEIFVIKNKAQVLNENAKIESKPVVNEQVDKMKHLLGYKPNNFTNTINVKKNRGF
jgi:hypothetical protein